MKRLVALHLAGVVAVGACDKGTDADKAARSPSVMPATVHISGEPTCTTCRVRTEVVSRFGATSGPASLTRQVRTAVRDSRGRVYVLSGELPQVFDSSGRFVRVIGAVGDGPGELRGVIAAALMRGDSFAVHSYPHSRISIFDSSGRFVRSITVAAPGPLWWMEMTPSGSIVGSGSVGSRPGNKGPIRIISGAGQLRAVFGLTGGAPEGGSDREVCVAPDGSIWSAAQETHLLEHFNSTGAPVASYAIDAAWYPRADMNWSPAPGRPPPTNVRRLFADSLGFVWIFSYVARKDWEASLSPSPTGRAGQYRYEPSRAFETRVEIFDPATHTILVSQVLPYFVTHGLRGGYLSAYAETGAGIPAVTILRVWLDR